jgi:hypothetical protein
MKIGVIISLLLAMLMLAGCSDEDGDTGTNPASMPGQPSGLSVTDKGLLSLTLSWDIVSDATGYVLYRSESETGSYTEVYAGAAAGFIDNTVTYAHTYWYQVCAENSAGEGDPCAPVSGTTDAPSGFVVSGSPSGGVDHTFNYLDDWNGKPRYQSDPIGLHIVFASWGDHDGQWIFYDMIETQDMYYAVSDDDYPPAAGWYMHVGDTRTNITLTPF